jgi:hypothetical protein
MHDWIKLPGISHEAALIGKVVDARTRRPIGGVTVSMVQMPPSFAGWLRTQALQHSDAWERLADRPDRAHTAEDGCFCFVDLPDGEYVLSFEPAPAAHRYGPSRKSFTVARDPQGQLQAPIHEILLPPTAVRGQVKGLVQGLASALPLSRVRVEDSGELAYGDLEGRFYLTGVEPGERVLHISAVGFQSVTKPVSITAGLVTELDPPVVLNPTSP